MCASKNGTLLHAQLVKTKSGQDISAGILLFEIACDLRQASNTIAQ